MRGSAPLRARPLPAAIDNLDSLNDLGSDLDVYKQNSRNWALFTHNIFHVTARSMLTVGLRYTTRSKKFDATFGNDNTSAPPTRRCSAFQSGQPGVPALFAVSQAILGLSARAIRRPSSTAFDRRQRSEGKFTGTGVLSYKPNDDLLLYASYSRGYKAGGFNLDRSALKLADRAVRQPGGAQALVGNLQFDPETVDAFEIGGKFRAAASCSTSRCSGRTSRTSS
jgi:iron complex outermembrane receptor protein